MVVCTSVTDAPSPPLSLLAISRIIWVRFSVKYVWERNATGSRYSLEAAPAKTRPREAAKRDSSMLEGFLKPSWGSHTSHQ